MSKHSCYSELLETGPRSLQLLALNTNLALLNAGILSKVYYESSVLNIPFLLEIVRKYQPLSVLKETSEI